jgi:hypothetical protein
MNHHQHYRSQNEDEEAWWDEEMKRREAAEVRRRRIANEGELAVLTWRWRVAPAIFEFFCDLVRCE